MLIALALVAQLAGRTAPTPAPAALDSAVHALNRLAYGPRPGQAAGIATTGVRQWIDAQLRADPGGRDPGAEPVLATFSLLHQSTTELGRAYQNMIAARNARQRADSGAMVPDRTNPTAAGREFRMLVGQLPAIAVQRASHADHQLVEVLVDFWTNHFNVALTKNLVPVYLPEYLERVIRPNIFGTFEDLLVATATSPAMLVYLDNAQSVAPGSEPPQLARLRQMQRSPRRAGRRPGADSAMARLMERMPSGLNENYARELLELHTLGVDGGYDQSAVVAVARILTGWSIDRGGPRREPGGFVFNAWAHDGGAKAVLDSVFPAGGGRDEGVRLLRILARHPATIHHLSTKLCARLVADVPPDGCVDDAARTWRRTGGNLREVVRAIVESPDFWAPANRGAKVKTPLEFVVSAARALGAEADTGRTLAAAVGRLGQPLFQQAAPTGYPETQDDWVNSGALLARMNFAVGLAAGRMAGVTVDLDRVVPVLSDPAALVAAVDLAVLAGRMSANTRAVIAREVATAASPAAARALAVGLALGSPEFQRQ